MADRANSGLKPLNLVKNSKHYQKVRIFSDEKLFLVDQVVNRQNDRYITLSTPFSTMAEEELCMFSEKTGHQHTPRV